MEALLLCWKGNPELAPPTRKHRWCHQVDRDALSLRQPPPPQGSLQPGTAERPLLLLRVPLLYK